MGTMFEESRYDFTERANNLLSCKPGLSEVKVWRENCFRNFHDKGLVCSKSHSAFLYSLIPPYIASQSHRQKQSTCEKPFSLSISKCHVSGNPSSNPPSHPPKIFLCISSISILRAFEYSFQKLFQSSLFIYAPSFFLYLFPILFVCKESHSLHDPHLEIFHQFLNQDR